MGKNITVIQGKTDAREKFSLYNPISILETGGKKLRVAAYCRVSTDSEDQQGSYMNQVRYYADSVSSNPALELVGVYGDEGKSGLSDKWRTDFNRMMDDCRAGKIDLVITKSISRFARNTQDCLKYTRELKSIGVAVFFEKENINTLDAKGELLFTILSVLAQEESRNLSDNVTWAYENQFSKGNVVVNAKRFYGFTKNEDGRLAPDDEQAPIVRRMYEEYLDGYTEHQIAKHLNADGIPGVFGKPRWASGIVHTVLTNEKNKGDLLLQKTVTDFFTKRSVKNEGQKQQFYVEDDHEGIVSVETWEAVRLEMERRKEYRAAHDIKTVRYSDALDPLQGKVICGGCGDIYTYYKKGVLHCRKGCPNRMVTKEDAEAIIVEACRELNKNRALLYKEWKEKYLNGNPLEKVRAHQMMTTIRPLAESFDAHLALKVLGWIRVERDGGYTVFFLDGTEIGL